MSFSITILGNGSATPTLARHLSGQVLNVHERFYLIDCGEGTQRRLLQCRIHPMKIQAVFLSHLHGDHVFGLFPLLSTLSLGGRKQPLHLFAPRPMDEMLEAQKRWGDGEYAFPVEYHEVRTREHTLLWENRSMQVWSVPLRHRGPCAGFLFREREPDLNVDKAAISRYGLSLAQITAAKRGEDLRLDDGTLLENERIAYRPYAPRSYAYLSDTEFSAKAVRLVRGVDLLYHEATFMETDRKLAGRTGHSTTLQAARAAREAGAGRLLVGHISARYKDEEAIEREVQSGFARSELAREGHTYSIDKRPPSPRPLPTETE